MRAFVKISLVLAMGCALASCGNNGLTWTPSTSGEGGFTNTIPSKPVKTEKTEVTPFGKQVVHFITWKPSSLSIDKFKLFQVSYTTCPERFSSDSIMMDVMLDSSIRMRKKDFTEKDIPTENISLNGYPGRALIFDAPGNQIVIVKQCITNNRRYDLTVIAKTNQGTNPEINTFFNSFQALK